MKNKKNYRQDEVEYEDTERFARPPIYNMDTIATMQDEELVKQLDAMHEGRNSSIKNRRAPTEWETEICYLRRELYFRRERRQAHEVYVRQIDNEFKMMQQQEKGLPVADLDNSKFMIFN